MAPTFLEPGTEATQDTLTFYPNQFFGGTGSASSATDQAHTGTRSLKLSDPDAGSPCFVATADGACGDAGTRLSVWVRFSIIPAAADIVFLAGTQAGFNSSPFLLAITAGAKLKLYRDDGVAAVGGAGATSISAATWTRITMSWMITSGTNWTCQVFINGVLEFTRTHADATLTNTGTSEVMVVVDRANAGFSREVMSIWFDDVYVDNSSALTDPGSTDANSLRVTCKLPSADGSLSEFTTAVGAASGAHFDDVAERPGNAANGWSISTTTKKTEEYTVQNAAAGDVDLTGKTIRAVMGWVLAKVDSIANSPVHHLLVDGTATALALATTEAAFQQASATPTVLPAGTGADIGLDAQYTATPHVTSLLECGILVAYDPAAASQVPYQSYYQGIVTQ